MIIDKIRLDNPDACKYYEANGKYYLIAPNTYFFMKMRLGD